MSEQGLVPRDRTNTNLPAVAAAAASAEAEIKAMYTAAMMRPRQFDDARQRVLSACRRPRFANDKSVLYAKPVGKTSITGPGIRLAEELARSLGNIRTTVEIRQDTREKRELVVAATDLETNTHFSQAVSVEKTIERKFTRQGQEIVSQRENSYGELVYLILASDDEMITKTNAQVSKALRNCILRLIPQDLVEDAIEEIERTRAKDFNDDPDAARKKVCDAFGAIGVMPSDIEAYAGSKIAQLTPETIADLRRIYGGIRDNETTWAEVMEARESRPEKGSLDLDSMKAGKPEDATQPGEAQAAQTKKARKPSVSGHKPDRSKKPPKPEPEPEPEPTPTPPPDKEEEASPDESGDDDEPASITVDRLSEDAQVLHPTNRRLVAMYIAREGDETYTIYEDQLDGSFHCTCEEFTPENGCAHCDAISD